MGDLSAEPSMEEILSSIKRIIAEEGDAAPARGRRPARGAATTLAPAPMADDEDEEVLELSDPIPAPAKAEPEAKPVDMNKPAESSRAADAPRSAERPTPAEPIVSPDAAAASRGALEVLSRLVVKPEPGNDGTLEGLVREMLRPMLRDWLDTHLPEMVEAMVSREISRIAGQAR